MAIFYALIYSLCSFPRAGNSHIKREVQIRKHLKVGALLCRTRDEKHLYDFHLGLLTKFPSWNLGHFLLYSRIIFAAGYYLYYLMSFWASRANSNVKRDHCCYYALLAKFSFILEANLKNLYSYYRHCVKLLALFYCYYYSKIILQFSYYLIIIIYLCYYYYYLNYYYYLYYYYYFLIFIINFKLKFFILFRVFQ